MKVLSWNCQGIGNPKTVRAFNKLLSDTRPDVFFIMETKLISNNNGFLSRLRNNYNIHHVDCSTAGGGRAGGLLMGCDPCTIDLSLMNDCSNYIDVQIKSNNIMWRATGLYGFPQNQNKFLTCSIIEELAEAPQHQNWLLFGDFNIILHNDEKMGGMLMTIGSLSGLETPSADVTCRIWAIREIFLPGPIGKRIITTSELGWIDFWLLKAGTMLSLLTKTTT
jgi:hypothetical protein